MNKTVIHQLKTDGRVLDGMSYVIECGDGSLVVIDGSMYEDGEAMYSYLRKLSGDRDPVVEAWFLTHAHPDHTYCCKSVADQFADKITVKKLIYRFPDEDFVRAKEPDCLVQIPAFEESARRFNAEHVIPSAGERYVFGDAVFEILFTCADLPSIFEVQGQVLNDTSLVFRLTAAGQSVLFLGDVQAAGNRVMMKKYKKALKSDVCQVAHHGFYASGSAFYDLVDPEILLWPASVRVFETFSLCVPASRHLVSSMNVKDIYLHGHGTVALEMPIRPRREPFLPQYGKYEDLSACEIKPELDVPFAEMAPDLKDPLSWSGEWKPIDGKILDDRIRVQSFYRALWREDCLYLNVRVDKPFVSNPERFSSSHCDTLRIYFTDRVYGERGISWDDLEEEHGVYPNVKLYAEEKNVNGKRFVNFGAGDACTSSYLVEKDRFYLTACLKMGSVHKKGDLVGLNLEIACVDDPTGLRKYHAVLVRDDHGGYYGNEPSAVVFARLS